MSRRVRDLLAGDLGAHRDLPVDPDDEPDAAVSENAPPTVSAGSGYGAAQAAAALERRRRELEHLVGITEGLTDK